MNSTVPQGLRKKNELALSVKILMFEMVHYCLFNRRTNAELYVVVLRIFSSI